MPYQSTFDLPKSVRNVLPLHAQNIYLSAYNASMDRYDNPSRIAWAAVSRSYEKSYDGTWVKRDKEEFTSTTEDEETETDETDTDEERHMSPP